MNRIRKILTDAKGATAIEYGLIAAMISIAALVGMQGLGNQLSNTFGTVATKLSDAGK